MPHHIDEPPQYFFWDMEDMFVVVMFAAVGIIISMLIPMLIIGLFVARWIGSKKREKLPGYLVHACYWIGVVELGPVFRNGTVREVIE